MRKFLVISLALLGFAIDAWSCGYGYYDGHNNYMFSVFRREAMQGPVSEDQLNQFWIDYTDGEAKTFEWGKETILETAKKKGDQEMLDYLTQLIRYVDISRDLQDSWNYPTNTMLQKASAYKGKRLQGQWNLLRMRANMVLGDHAANINFWNQTGSKLPQSIYKTMMESIYAGALLHTGKQREAFDIYAKNGDLVSIKWAMRKYRNLAGIQRIYEEDPNSPCMPFLVQDFVNNTQETLDCSSPEYCEDWLKELDARFIQRQEADRFIDYANTVIKSGKTKNPALWQAAIGELQYLNGQYMEAYASLDKATGMKGTARMLDNARAIRMIASVKSHALDSKYTQWMAGEMNWLIGKIREEAASSPNADSPYYGVYNHYYDILDRLIYKELAPKYVANGRPDMAAALKGMLNDSDAILGKKTEHLEESTWNDNYSNEYFYTLDLMSAEQTVDYLRFLQDSKGDDMERLVKNYLNYDVNFFNDLIGTKFLAENQFDKAIPYLQKVPLSFMEGQNISCYLATRDWHKSKWLVNQRESIFDVSEGPHTGKLTNNPKLEFCKEMIDLQKRYQSANKNTRPQVAYDLANNYYQASYLGDCWYLTQYGSSVSDTARVDRPNFVEIAIKYLNESKTAKNLKLQENSLFGLAFIPYDAWYVEDWNDTTGDFETIIKRNSRQFKALNELNSFVNSHRDQVSSQVSRCDVLKQFRKEI